MQVQTNYTEDLDEVVAILCNLNFFLLQLTNKYVPIFLYVNQVQTSKISVINNKLTEAIKKLLKLS